jgi:hypothetical protein
MAVRRKRVAATLDMRQRLFVSLYLEQRHPFEHDALDKLPLTEVFAHDEPKELPPVRWPEPEGYRSQVDQDRYQLPSDNRICCDYDSEAGRTVHRQQREQRCHHAGDDHIAEDTAGEHERVTPPARDEHLMIPAKFYRRIAPWPRRENGTSANSDGDDAHTDGAGQCCMSNFVRHASDEVGTGNDAEEEEKYPSRATPLSANIEINSPTGVMTKALMYVASSS